MSGVISSQEALSSAHNIDYVATIPYSSNIEVVGNRLTPVLAIMSRMALDASIAVWERHQNSQLIMIGETCYPGLPSTSDLMEQRAAGLISDTPGLNKIVPLAESNGVTLDNTALHVSGLAEYLGGEPEGTTIAVGMKYHAERVLNHAEGNGINLEYVAAEDVLEAVDRIEEYEPFLDYLTKLERSERILRIMSRFNPKGSLFKAAAKMAGPRVVDFKKSGDGEVEFISSTARRRLAEEKRKLQPVAQLFPSS